MTKNNKIDIYKELQNKFIVKESIIDGKYTKTTQFMLHSIGININNKWVSKFFVNAFLKDLANEIKFKYPIYVLLKVENKDDPAWVYLSKAFSESTNYVCDYNVSTEGTTQLIMFVFTVPEKFQKDYHFFILGKYSCFSKEYKEKFNRYVEKDGAKRESILYQIIHKSETLMRKLEEQYMLEPGFMKKECEEIWDKVRIEREFYNYEKI